MLNKRKNKKKLKNEIIKNKRKKRIKKFLSYKIINKTLLIILLIFYCIYKGKLFDNINLFTLIKLNYEKYIPKEIFLGIPEEQMLYNFLHMKNRPKNPNAPLILKEKKELLNTISKRINRNISKVNLLYIRGKFRFGNFLIVLNNAIFFCELLGCKRMIFQCLKDLFINKTIYYEKYNMTIEPDKAYDHSAPNSILLESNFFYLYHKYIKPESRFFVFKKEILNNLPKIDIHPDDLYIHIRSNEIFTGRYETYSQPPFCFYKDIINNFKFRKIFIIAENELNPVINKILTDFPSVQYNKNSFDIDVAYLANAYNIVASISSFLLSNIKLNDNLKNLWEYDIYRLTEKYFHLHHSVYKIPHKYNIYRMNPSKKYKTFMYKWLNTFEQRELMINEKCTGKFLKIFPRQF